MKMDFPKKSYHLSCPICSNYDVRERYGINGFTIVQCRLCKVMFVKDQLSQEELDFHYGKDTEIMTSEEDCVYLNDKNLQNLNYYYCNLRSLILDKFPVGSLLDVGCNTGQFLDVMTDFDCYGIERSPSHAKRAREKHGEKIFTGTFEAYQPPGILFDCITLQDVLDHMVDPVDMLKKCNRLLKPKGLLVVKVHDASCWYAKIMGKNFYAFIPPLHLFYFNKTSLVTAFEKASIDLIHSEHMGHEMFLSTIFYRLSKGNLRSIFFKLYSQTNGSWLGERKIVKNLHDVITVFGVKKGKDVF